MRMEPMRSSADDVAKIMAGMISDPVVLSRIVPHWESLFRTDEANIIGGWCVEHHDKYKQPPREEIIDYLRRWSANRDQQQVEPLERLLASARKQLRRNLTSDYVLDLAGREFNRVRLRRLSKGITSDLELDDLERALERVGDLSRVELGKEALSEPLDEESLWEAAFNKDHHQRNLIQYKRGLDDFFSGMLTRGSLISFMAPDKSGKSYWLLDMAWRALEQQHRVAYFECGDLSREDVIVRLGERATKIPSVKQNDFDDENELIGKLKIPTKVRKNNSDRKLEIEYTDRRYEPLMWGQAFDAFKKGCRGQLKLSVHSNDTLSVERINSILKIWENDFVPDAIFVDYADILAPPSGIRDPLDQQDKTWKQLRRLSQDWHCLVVTASQVNATAYRGGLLRKKHFSGRKTKLAHVNGMIGINVLDDENDKDRGVTRLNWIVRRKGRFNENKTCDCVGNFAVGCPSIRSVF